MKKNHLQFFLAILMTLMMLIASSYAGIAQTSSKRISGHIADEDGAPLPGVVVLVKGTSVATTSNSNGDFSFNIPSKSTTLEFSCLGMETKEVAIGNMTYFNVTMATSSFGLEETVVVGYGTMTKRDVTSSISSVKSEKLNDRASALNIIQGLAGKVAGVRSFSFSGRPGGNSSMRIRGMGSINAGSDPIYVLDGVVGVSVSMINSSDIESIDILKDAAATAMYGAQGANGVVLITTKTGKAGTGSVTYDGKVGVSMMTRKLDLLNSEEYMEVQKRAYAYSGNTMPHLTTPMENLFYYQKDASGNYVYDGNGLLIASPKYDTDWQDVMTQNALVQDHSLSFVSGNDKTSVYASLSYQDVNGLIRYTYSKRYTGTINVKSKINDWLDIQAMATGGNTETNNSDSENGFGQGALRNMIEMPPIIPVKYEDGTWGRKGDYPLGEVAENPLNLLENMKKIDRSNYYLMSLAANLKLMKDLTLTVKGDYNMIDSKNISYAKAGLLDYSENNGGYATIGNSDTKKYSNEDYLTYNKSFLDSKLKSSFVLGASWYYNHSESATAGSEDYFDDSFQYYNLGAGSVYQQPSSSMSQNTINSFYFRMNHSFLNRYMLGFTFRADGASNFGKNNKYGYFPSASAAWLMSDEPFFATAKKYVNNLKLRISYGSVGNASIPNYRTISQYSNGNTIFNNTLTPYVVLSNLGNADLKWETTRQANVGIDASFLNDRIGLIMDYYNKTTTDLLFQKQVPYTTGYSTSWTNLGKIRNTGLEITLSTHNITNKNFTWDTDFIYSTNKIKVVDINGEVIELGNNARAVEGEDWGSFYVYKRLGTWGLDEVEEAAKYGKKPGDIKYEDVDHNYVINDNDRQNLGSGTPKGYFSLVNTFQYKGLSLMVDLGAQYGSKVMDITQAMLENRQLYANSVKTVLDAWTPEHQNTLVAAIRRPSDTYFGENEKDSRMLYSADFIRVRNVVLSYDFSKGLLHMIRDVKGLTLGLIVENPYILTKYPGYDPEVGAFTNADTGIGIDFYNYPRPTTVSGSLKITF